MKEFVNVIFIILLFAEGGLLFIVNSKGMIYDVTKEKFDRNYAVNHSFRYKYGRFMFSIPFYIVEKSKNDSLQKSANQYNAYSIMFWIIGVLLFILSNIK